MNQKLSFPILFIFLCLVLLLSACASGTTTPVPSATGAPSPTPEIGLTATPTQFNGVCSYVWATRAQPELSNALKKAFREAQMPEVEVDASAYGENCLDWATNSVVSFAAMQTDLSLNVVVDDTSNTTVMGEWIIKMYSLLENLPAKMLPGEKLGNIQVQYEDGKNRVSLSFTHQQGQEAIKQGLRGTRLFDALNIP